MREVDDNREADDLDAKPLAIERMGKVAVYGVAIVGGWLLSQWIELRAELHPMRVGLAIALIAVACYGVYWRRQQRTDAAFDYSWVPPVAIVAVLCAFGFENAHRMRTNYITPYCEYGAVSQAQLDGCLTHVTSSYIDKLDTQAALFARGVNNDCLADSGPFCADAARSQTLKDQAEPPQ